MADCCPLRRGAKEGHFAVGALGGALVAESGARAGGRWGPGYAGAQQGYEQADTGFGAWLNPIFAQQGHPGWRADVGLG